MRLRVFILVCVSVIALATIWTFKSFYCKSLNHRINEDSYEKICAGMTESEVVTIIGVSHGQYYSGKAHVIIPFEPIKTTGETFTDRLREGILLQNVRVDGKLVLQTKGWVGEHMSIWVSFDEHGVVTEKSSYPVTPVHQGVLGWIYNFVPW